MKEEFYSNYKDLNPLYHDIYLEQLFKHNRKVDEYVEL